MMKQHKKALIFSSLAILLPAVAGLLLWNKLPDTMATHWNAAGTADGNSGKAFAVLGLPLILLALHWLCIFATVKDRKNKDQNKKAFSMVLWIIPLLSFYAQGLVLSTAMGHPFHASMLTGLLCGVMFMLIGNYLPKCKQNRTIGIKIKWTLESEANWNATHRFCGKVWVIGGIVFLPCSFLPARLLPWVMLVLISVMVALPMIYSYRYYRRQPKEELSPVKSSKWVKWGSVIFGVLILVFVLVLCFTGRVEYAFGQEQLSIEASYWVDLDIPYENIVSIAYAQNYDRGIRVSGFGSPKLSLGSFQSDTLGGYTSYAYTQCDDAVILVTKANTTVVLNAETAEKTKQLYDRLSQRLP